MSASQNKNKNKTSGLRFLWIPGRKKHDHKGRYDATNKQVQYSGGTFGHKNNQPWSLGGSKGLEKLTESDIPGSSEGTSRITAALPAIAAGASGTVMKLDDTNQFSILDAKNEKDITSSTEFLKSHDVNSDKANRDDHRSPDSSRENYPSKNEKDDGGNKSESPEKKNNHRKKSKDSNNAIETLQDKKLKDSSFDITDSSLYINKYNGKKKNKKKKKNYCDPNDSEEDDPDAKIVKCLYFTLMCCECSIS